MYYKEYPKVNLLRSILCKFIITYRTEVCEFICVHAPLLFVVRQKKIIYKLCIPTYFLFPGAVQNLTYHPDFLEIC